MTVNKCQNNANGKEENNPFAGHNNKVFVSWIIISHYTSNVIYVPYTFLLIVRSRCEQRLDGAEHLVPCRILSVRRRASIALRCVIKLNNSLLHFAVPGLKLVFLLLKKKHNQ